MRKIVIDPRVIKHLGRDLITSSDVAIIELVKNALDAKAQTINLRICNNVLPQGLLDITKIANVPENYLKMPMLLVEDDGLGMTDHAIDEGFLKIATNIKVNEKGVLGQKGIGRLATQRLGTALLVETSSSAEDHTSFVFIDWDAVINGATNVPSFESEATSHHTPLMPQLQQKRLCKLIESLNQHSTFWSHPLRMGKSHQQLTFISTIERLI